MSAVLKKTVGDAHFILAMLAMNEGDFVSMDNHLGYADATLFPLGPDALDEASNRIYYGLVERNNGLWAQTGRASSIAIENCSWIIFGQDATIQASKVRTLTPWYTGTLTMVLWYCNSPFDGTGTPDGIAMAEGQIGVLKGGWQGVREQINGKTYIHTRYVLERGESAKIRSPVTGNPSTGDYWSVVTVEELNADGNWYIVGYATFPNLTHWNHKESW